jgi:hypothetical protein
MIEPDWREFVLTFDATAPLGLPARRVIQWLIAERLEKMRRTEREFIPDRELHRVVALAKLEQKLAALWPGSV